MRFTVRVGRRIRAARQRQQMTQQALASQLGVPYQMIQRYERGEKLSLDHVITLAVVLDVHPEWLLTGRRIRKP